MNTNLVKSFGTSDGPRYVRTISISIMAVSFGRSIGGCRSSNEIFAHRYVRAVANERKIMIFRRMILASITRHLPSSANFVTFKSSAWRSNIRWKKSTRVATSISKPMNERECPMGKKINQTRMNHCRAIESDRTNESSFDNSFVVAQTSERTKKFSKIQLEAQTS